MRFDEYLKECGIAVFAVDRFAGFKVEVGLPSGWEPFDSAVGLRVWVCCTDPHIGQFCANAVLTMHRVEAPINGREVFAMLVEQQTGSAPGCRELHHELETATEGVGLVGTCAMRVPHELGTIDSVVRTRIITTERDTSIAQLTVTALQNSPADHVGAWLTVRTGAAAGSVATGRRHGVPTAGTRKGQ
jgi:hypothetical protein